MNENSTSTMSATQVRLRDLNKKIADTTQILRNQHQVLQQRGMNLPSSALDGLRTLKTRADGLGRSILDSQVELQQLRRLAETTALINSAQETDAVLNEVMETVITLTQAERGYIMLKNHETGQLEFKVARGIDMSGSESDQKIISLSVVNQVAETGEPILTDNASTDARLSGSESIVGFALRSILAVPLKVRGEVIGVAYCDNRIMQGLFKSNELDLMTAFGQQAAVAIENARLFEDIRSQLAEIDEIRIRLDNIFSSIASGVITVNADDLVIVCNDAAVDITGTDNPIGRPLRDILPAMDEKFYDTLRKVRAEEEQILWNTETNVNGNGKRYWQVVASPLLGEEQIADGLAIVIDDLTERKAREDQLAEVGKYLPEALVANISSADSIDMSAQERNITALFADVRGFTSFSENLQPEDLMQIINRYLSVASDGINLYEGIVDKYMGDAVTGLWNTQLNPQEDHAQRAIQAAHSVMYDLFALHEVLAENEQLYFGIGIHSGPAVLGNVGGEGRVEFAALGEAMDDCKFLQESAGPGEIIISPQTYELIKDFFEAEAMEPKKMKPGYEHYTTIYKLGKRKKSLETSSLFVDQELLDLLSDLDD